MAKICFVVQDSYDFGIIGAGIIGLSIAHQIQQEFPSAKVVIFDKEPSVGAHASGRNSGVIHAGFYYSPDSLKARLTKNGNQLLHRFCDENNIPVNRCGKVVVAQNESELSELKNLNFRSVKNGVKTELINSDQLRELEPIAQTYELALWSPTTSVANPYLVSRVLSEKIKRNGAELFLNTPVQKIGKNQIITKGSKFHIGHIVNAAGLYSDKFARALGFSDEYTMLPFKGIYRYGNWKPGTLKRHIYPVPDPRNPFLGVHLTVTAEGKAKIGPTAIPVISRENYKVWENLKVNEILQIISIYPGFLTSKHHDSLGLIRSELPKYINFFLVAQAKKLAPKVSVQDFKTRGIPGIRAQLFNTKEKRLEMDFVFRGDECSTHILNSVSPAWTSSFAISEFIVDDLVKRMH